MEVVFHIHVGDNIRPELEVSTDNACRQSACLGAITFTPLWALSPREPPVDRHGKIDCIGSALGTSSLILFNFVWK
jgi:hypothetical protein